MEEFDKEARKVYPRQAAGTLTSRQKRLKLYRRLRPAAVCIGGTAALVGLAAAVSCLQPLFALPVVFFILGILSCTLPRHSLVVRILYFPGNSASEEAGLEGAFLSGMAGILVGVLSLCMFFYCFW